MKTTPSRLVIVDIDGLRQDIFHRALEDGRVPSLARLLGGAAPERCIHVDPVSTLPSITFCAQSSIFTGQAPDQHGIPGNQFFDRFGLRSSLPRFYAFDVGDALAYNDAVLTFKGPLGLVDRVLAPEVPTIYELAAARGLVSTVVYNMVSRGAAQWIRPDLIDIARFTKGGGLIGLSAAAYDHEMMEKTIQHLRSGAQPDILTVYFMGLDHTSHHDGPGAQMDYLSRVVDQELGLLVDELEQQSLLAGTLVAVVSDHGQIQVIPDDRHSLRLSFPFDREMGYLFDALGLDVHDVPGEGPACEAVVASNGGLAHVYLRRRGAEWSALPRFEEDVLPVALAFWEANLSGLRAPDLQGALAIILARSAEHAGWQADYQAVTQAGQLVPVQQYLDEHPEIQAVDAAARLRHLAGPLSGDLLLVSNYADGFYFGGITTGVHGGMHPDDSRCVLSLSWLGAQEEDVDRLREAVAGTLRERLAADGRRYASITDFVPVIKQVFDL